MYPLSVAARCTGAACVPIILLLLFVKPKWLPGLGRQVNSWLDAVSRRPAKFAIWVALSTFVLNAAISCFSFWPIPSVHDEFAYVLTGDTFASGRLTNPTHRFAEHFASWHIIQEPSYQAKYPPAQGAALAMGQVLFGYPLVGAWISLAIAIAISVWATFQWLPRRWAAYASLLIALNPHIHLRWGQSYWGGAIALAGGALLVGALGRLRHHPGLIAGLAAGLGLAVLAASRPFEGLLMSGPICLFAGWRIVKRFDKQQLVVAVSGGIVLLAGGMLLAQYDRAVTGKWSQLPYRVWLRQQGDALDRILTPSVIPLKNVSAPSVHAIDGKTAAENDWRVSEMARMMGNRKADAFNFKRQKVWQMLEFYFQSLLWIPLLLIPLVIRDKWRAVLFASVAIVLAGSCTHLSAGHAHYIAGLTAGLMIVVTMCLRRLEAVNLFGHRMGPTITSLTLICWLAIAGLTFAADFIEQPRARRLRWAYRRQAIEQKLSTVSDHNVVFVRYLPDHNIHQEWVYNGANIDSQQIIWANDLGDHANRGLIEYLSQVIDRKVGPALKAWLLVAGDENEELLPYPTTETEPAV